MERSRIGCADSFLWGKEVGVWGAGRGYGGRAAGKGRGKGGDTASSEGGICMPTSSP